MTPTSENLREAERQVAALQPKASDPIRAAVKALAACLVFSLVSSVLSHVGIPPLAREAIAASCAMAMAYFDARGAERRYVIARQEALQTVMERDRDNSLLSK